MKFVADLHLHSKYSRAVSQEMILPKMAQWAKLKGINVLATGDFTHPFWFDQLKKELIDDGNGLYRLKPTIDNSHLTIDKSKSSVNGSPRFAPASTIVAGEAGQMLNVKQEVYFMLSCEIASIYSQGGKVRRIHNLFFFPSLGSVEKFNRALLARGASLRSDGRPVVGINSRDLAEVALKVDKKALVIPAHAWTPWFSIFGSFSGFDSIAECFGDMSKYIYGIETGLSSDPAMNWRIEDLDSRAILSFSDAHSLEKMGREATVFEAEELSYESIYDAIRLSGNQAIGLSGKQMPDYQTSREPSNPSKIAFTIEFYPEEGKYHFTGHRDCNFRQSPEETAKNGNICPVCRRPLTIGVMHRVKQLASREISNFKFPISNGVKWVKSEEGRPPYVSMVPLGEILAEALGAAVKTQKVSDTYFQLVNNLGSEFNVLLKADLSDIARFSNQKVAEGIDLVRRGEIIVDPGYDGNFGVVKIWPDVPSSEPKVEPSQLNLFA
ncbi:DNA helicase UvrD [Candidatus Curtissbacteria bacterium]|nr:DNA helicase UvrD [Candidatus Curtissbacteria bacterium]